MPEVAGQPVGLLLAAGGSRRLGRPKQLLELGGEPLVRRTAKLLLACMDEVVVVTGAAADEVERALAGLPVQTVRNISWREGMGASLALGVRSLCAQSPGALVMLSDLARVDEGDLRSLLAAWTDDASRIVAARWPGGFGPPAVFPRTALPALATLSGDRGAKSIIENDPGARFVDMPSAAEDLDGPADVGRLLQSPVR